MYKTEDLNFLCCPKCKSDLTESGDMLICASCSKQYPIYDGIPRLLYLGDEDTTYNTMWDYEWYVLDGGKGLNYMAHERGSEAYKQTGSLVEEIFDNNNSGVSDLAGGVVADIGAGTCPYSVLLCQKGAKRVYAVDLTRAVDIGKKIIEERYPEYLDRIVFIQANARFLPLKDNVCDLSMALASIHHSGFLEDCIREVVRVAKSSKKIMVWIYAKPVMPIGDKIRNLKGWLKLLYYCFRILQVEAWLNVTKRLPHNVLMLLLRFMASDFVYFLYTKPRFIRGMTQILLPGIAFHPDKDYRLLNLHDTYSPSFSEASDEGDVIRWSKLHNFSLLEFFSWRLGFVARKN